MLTLKQFQNAYELPQAQFMAGSGSNADLTQSANRDEINQLLAGVTSAQFLTPYIALERVSKALAYWNIILPKQIFFNGDNDFTAFEINQFGKVWDISGTPESEVTPYYLYFEYVMNDIGSYSVYAEMVTEDELEELVSDAESEEGDE